MRDTEMEQQQDSAENCTQPHCMMTWLDKKKMQALSYLISGDWAA